jgi:hypothetical protein
MILGGHQKTINGAESFGLVEGSGTVDPSTRTAPAFAVPARNFRRGCFARRVVSDSPTRPSDDLALHPLLHKYPDGAQHRFSPSR